MIFCKKRLIILQKLHQKRAAIFWRKMNKTPEAKQGDITTVVHGLITRGGSWPDGNVILARVDPGKKIPAFPVLCITPECGFVGNGVSAKTSFNRDRVMILLPTGEAIGVAFQRARDGSGSINLMPEGSVVSDNVRFARNFMTVGRLPNGTEGGLRVIADGGLSYQIEPVSFPLNWDEKIKQGPLEESDFIQFTQSGPDIAAMLKGNPQLGFLALANIVKRLPVGASARLGYHPGHNDNPVKVEEKDGEIVARFLYPDIPTLAARIKEGKLSPRVFLQECLLPRASLLVRDVIELHTKLDKATGEVEISLAIQRLDPEQPNKPIRVDSLQSLAPQLTVAGVGAGQFGAALMEILGTEQGVGEIFASLNPEPEVVEQPRVAEIPVTWGLRTTSGKRDTSSAEPWRNRQDRQNQGEKLKKAPTLVRSRGSKWEKKEAVEEGKRRWVHRNSSAVHSRNSAKK